MLPDKHDKMEYSIRSAIDTLQYEHNRTVLSSSNQVPFFLHSFFMQHIVMQHTNSFHDTTQSPLRLGVVAGGTGGHLFPAIAIVEALQEIHGSVQCSFFGTTTKIEARIVPSLGYDFTPLPITALAGFSLQTLLFPFRLIQSVVQAYTVLHKKKIMALLCAGAYMSVPVGIAARLLGIPIFLIETNAIAGRAIRLLAGSAQHIYAAYPEGKEDLASYQDKISVMGNPVRKAFRMNATQAEARQAFGLQPSAPTILVFGGSLGARSLNDAVRNASHDLTNEGVQIIWQTGKDYPAPSNTNTMKIFPFITDMAQALASADLVICRAGASTLAELSVAGKPAILIPFPHAANDHQRANAQSFVRQGAALMVEDSAISEQFFSLVMNLLHHPEQRATLSDAMRRLHGADSAQRIAQHILIEISA